MKIVREYRFQIIISFLGILWLLFNNYFLPFHPWTTGLVRPWFMINGLIPYRDFVWIRMPADIFILSWWYSIFDVSPYAYQLFISIVLVLTFIFVYLTACTVSKKYAFIASLFYALLYPVLFFNTEVGELLIGLYSVIGVYVFLTFVSKENNVLLVVLGIFCGLLFVTKQSTAFFSFAILISLIIYNLYHGESVKAITKQTGIFGTGVLIPLTILILYYALQGSLDSLYHYTVSFIIVSYPSAPVTKGAGLALASGLLVLLIPFLISTHKTNKVVRVLLVTAILSLIPSLLPSFLSYRAYPLFPLVALTSSYSIVFLFTSKSKSLKIVVIASYLLSFLLLYPFAKDYRVFVEQNGFVYGQLLFDYGETEKHIANWIKQNTTKDDKIIVYTNNIIYTLSDRLPANKYVDPFPYMIEPYDVATKVFNSNPPEIFVYDESLPEVHIGLDDFPFVANINENYTKRFSIDTVSVYQRTN